MQVKENMTSRAIVMGEETSSSYHVGTRNDAPSQMGVSLPGVMTPMTAGMPEMMDKKKRGRPRKNGPERSITKASVVSSATSDVGSYPVEKQAKGKSTAKRKPALDMVSMDEGVGRTDGFNFTPHVITVNIGEDVTEKMISFCQQGPRSIFILSASGMVSNATLRQCESSGGTLTYEGRFEIISLCGSFTSTEKEGKRFRAGGLSLSLSSPNGRVVGGSIAGLLIAASTVQIIVGSFLPTSPLELKPKKPKVSSTTAPFTITANPVTPSPPPSVSDKEAHNGQQGHNNSVTPMQNFTPTSYQRDNTNNWPNAQHSHSMQQERRVSTTDINISLPGG